MDFRTRSGSGEFDLSDPVRSFVDTVRRVILSPRVFFRGMPRRGIFLNPLIFAAVCALIGVLMSGIFQKVAQTLVAQALPGMKIFTVKTGFVLSVTYGFLGIMIGLVVITGIYALLFRLIGGRYYGGLEGTFRVLCYVQVVLLVVWLPLVNVLALIYALQLGIFGFAEVHTTTYRRAALIVALPILLWKLQRTLLFLFAAVFLTAAFFLSG
jgi:hypothetical protein